MTRARTERPMQHRKETWKKGWNKWKYPKHVGRYSRKREGRKYYGSVVISNEGILVNKYVR